MTTLGFRLDRLLQDTCDIWRPDDSAADSQGVAQAATWTRVVAGQRCYYDFTPNANNPTEAGGRQRSENFFTTDQIWMPIGVDVRGGDFLRLTTSGSVTAGAWHHVAGAPNLLRGTAGRVGSLMVMAMEFEKPPAELLAAAGV